jgi:lysophospholipase L1-like esterase
MFTQRRSVRSFCAHAAMIVLIAAASPACGSKSPIAPTPPPQTPTPPTPPPQPQPTPDPPPPAPTLRFTTFVAFGDSLTEGTISPAPTLLLKLDPSQAYPALLQGLLVQRYTKQTPIVLNRGKAGEQAVDGQSRFIDVLRQDSPQVIVLLDGYNDLAAYGSNGITRAVGAIETMVKQARSRGIIVILATLPPERPGAQRALSASITNEFNRQIIGTAQDEGAQLVDLTHELDLSAIGVDGLHLTEAGYQQLANIFYMHIQSLYEQAPTTTKKPAAVTQTTHR